VKWFDQIQGVGIVRVASRGEAHVYYKEILDPGYRALEAGDTISFWVDATDRGLVARDVRLVDSLPR
jgi:CspA family cold shock protein